MGFNDADYVVHQHLIMNYMLHHDSRYLGLILYLFYGDGQNSYNGSDMIGLYFRRLWNSIEVMMIILGDFYTVHVICIFTYYIIAQMVSIF